MASPAARQTAVAVLAAISVCHLFNDMMQSLRGALPDDERGPTRSTSARSGSSPSPSPSPPPCCSRSSASTRTATRHHTLSCPGMGCSLHRPPAGRRLAPTYGVPARRRRADRRRIVHLSSGVVARRADCFRRPARSRPIGLPSRRQCRHRPRSAARGLHRPALRPASLAWFAVVALIGMVDACRGSAAGTARR